jgi:predicted acyl esterase
MRAEAEWPLARTQYTKFFLDARSRTLATAVVERPSEAGYDAQTGRAIFEHRFARDTEVTGYAKLKLWVATSAGQDMDLFVAIYKIDTKGETVPLAFFSVFEKGPVALGWLRVSHRELDPARSTAHQPWLLHRRELPLTPGERVPVEIEIWPSCMLYREGETLQLIVQGRDFYYGKPEEGPTMGHGPLRNEGEHILFTGGACDSHLLLPIIPPKH